MRIEVADQAPLPRDPEEPDAADIARHAFDRVAAQNARVRRRIDYCLDSRFLNSQNQMDAVDCTQWIAAGQRGGLEARRYRVEQLGCEAEVPAGTYRCRWHQTSDVHWLDGGPFERGIMRSELGIEPGGTFVARFRRAGTGEQRWIATELAP